MLKRKATNQGGWKTVKKLTGRKKRRTRMVKKRRNMRKVRATKRAIKQLVKHEMSCSDNVGIYSKTYVGEIDPKVSAGQKNVAFGFTREQAQAGDFTQFTTSFTPFIAKRVLDAASVLFNGKGANMNIDASGNFANATNIKLDVHYASYSLELYNYTNIPYEITIMEVTNKFTDQTNFLTNAKNLLTVSGFSGTVPTFNNTGFLSQYAMDGELDFGMIKSLSSRYKIISSKERVVHPGQKASYFSKFAGCVDFKKKQYNLVDAISLGSYNHGEKQVVIMYRPVLHLYANATTYVATHQNNADNIESGFLVKVKEVWKMIEPDITEDAYQGDKRVHFNSQPTLTEAASIYINTEKHVQTIDPTNS